jgi:hypothetical protein
MKIFWGALFLEALAPRMGGETFLRLSAAIIHPIRTSVSDILGSLGRPQLLSSAYQSWS